MPSCGPTSMLRSSCLHSSICLPAPLFHLAVVHVIDNVLLPYIPASPLLPVGTKPQPGTGSVGAASLGGSGTGSTSGGSTDPVTGNVGAESLDTTPAAAPEAASPTAEEPVPSPEASPAEPSGPSTEESPPAEESPAPEPAAEPTPSEGPDYADLVEVKAAAVCVFCSSCAG